MKKLLFLFLLCCTYSFCSAPEIVYKESSNSYEAIQKETLFFHLYDKALVKLKEFEGLRLTPYIDCHGMAIGYGHKIISTETFTSITEKDAETLLKIDFEKAIKTVEKITGLNRFNNPGKVLALSHFVYQFGGTAFQYSTLLKKIQQNQSIVDEITRWTYASIDGRKLSLPSLERRRQYELNLYYS